MQAIIVIIRHLQLKTKKLSRALAVKTMPYEFMGISVFSIYLVSQNPKVRTRM